MHQTPSSLSEEPPLLPWRASLRPARHRRGAVSDARGCQWRIDRHRDGMGQALMFEMRFPSQHHHHPSPTRPFSPPPPHPSSLSLGPSGRSIRPHQRAAGSPLPAAWHRACSALLLTLGAPASITGTAGVLPPPPPGPQNLPPHPLISLPFLPLWSD